MALLFVFQSVVFKPPIYHPVVNWETGELDVRRAFPKWRLALIDNNMELVFKGFWGFLY